MNTEEIQAILVKAAESDLRKAAKYGSLLIAQTTKGTVKVTHQGNGYYFITRQGTPEREPEILMATARKAQAMKVLVPLYVVEFG